MYQQRWLQLYHNQSHATLSKVKGLVAYPCLRRRVTNAEAHRGAQINRTMMTEITYFGWCKVRSTWSKPVSQSCCEGSLLLLTSTGEGPLARLAPSSNITAGINASPNTSAHRNKTCEMTLKSDMSHSMIKMSYELCDVSFGGECGGANLENADRMIWGTNQGIPHRWD